MTRPPRAGGGDDSGRHYSRSDGGVAWGSSTSKVDSGRQRELFPVALVPEPRADHAMARSVHRRVARRGAIARVMNEAIVGLNALFFGVGLEEALALASQAQWHVGHRSVHERVRRGAQEVGVEPPVSDNSGALSALR